MNKEIDETEFTGMAWESIYDAVDDIRFKEKDAEIIYNSLKTKVRPLSFADYLKRYIYRRAELSRKFWDVPIEEYQEIIKGSFSDNQTPASFSNVSSKLSQLSKNWLTQRSVKREVVFLLGFGLSMSAEDVNSFLTKALLDEGINPKDPFEVICYYCYKNGFNYLKYVDLWSKYEALSPLVPGTEGYVTDETMVLNSSLHSIKNEVALMNYLSLLKISKAESGFYSTAMKTFKMLYGEAKEKIADLYNVTAEKGEVYEAFDISESDFEHIICSAVPKDRYGNLSPAKLSDLNEQFSGKRFSRQHIGEILSGAVRVSRFDLITLNFLLYCLELDKYTNVRARYSSFFESTNRILTKCFMGEMIVQNPYEGFILMCILSDDPLGTFADVWEMSFEGTTDGKEK